VTARELARERSQEIAEAVSRNGWSLTGLAAQLGISYRKAREVVSHWKALEGEEPSKHRERVEVQVEGNQATVKADNLQQIRTLEELAESCIDTRSWIVKRHQVTKWDMGMKGPDGEPVIQPLYRVWADMVPKVLSRPEFPPVQPVAVSVSGSATSAPVAPASGLRTALIVPDSQNGYKRDLLTGQLEPFHDRRAWDIALQVASEVQPDVVVFLGDMLDLPDWSDKFLRSPEMTETTQPAIVELSWWLMRFRAACPHAEMHYLQGNHEARFKAAVVSNMKAAYGLKPADEVSGDSADAFSLERLLCLETLDIQMHPYPDGEVWLSEHLLATHGTRAKAGGGKTAHAVLQESQESVIFGHVHRMELASRTLQSRRGQRVIQAFSPGTISRIDGAVPAATPRVDWQQGLGLVEFDKGPLVGITPLPIQEGRCFFEGTVLEGEMDMEMLMDDTGGLFKYD
jgi:hypothetical protein